MAFFSRDLVEGELRVPYDRQKLRGEIFAACEVLGERYEDDGVVFRVRAPRVAREAARGVALSGRADPRNGLPTATGRPRAAGPGDRASRPGS